METVRRVFNFYLFSSTIVGRLFVYILDWLVWDSNPCQSRNLPKDFGRTCPSTIAKPILLSTWDRIRFGGRWDSDGGEWELRRICRG